MYRAYTRHSTRRGFASYLSPFAVVGRRTTGKLCSTNSPRSLAALSAMLDSLTSIFRKFVESTPMGLVKGLSAVGLTIGSKGQIFNSRTKLLSWCMRRKVDEHEPDATEAAWHTLLRLFGL